MTATPQGGGDGETQKLNLRPNETERRADGSHSSGVASVWRCWRSGRGDAARGEGANRSEGGATYRVVLTSRGQ